MAENADNKPTNANDTSTPPDEDVTPGSQADTPPADDQDTTATGVDDTDDEDTEDDEGDDDQDDGETPPDGDDDPSGDDDTPDDSEAKRKAGAQKGYQQRQERKAHKSLEERANDLERNGDPNDANHRIKVLEARDFVREVRANQRELESDNTRVEQEFPIFNPESKEYNQKAAEAAMRKFARTYVQTDPETGEVLGAYDPKTGRPVSFYQFMQEEADVLSDVAKSGALRGQQAEQHMRASAEPSGSSVPNKKPKDDPDLDGWGDTGY